MEEAGILENSTLLSQLLPDFEPGPDRVIKAENFNPLFDQVSHEVSKTGGSIHESNDYKLPGGTGRDPVWKRGSSAEIVGVNSIDGLGSGSTGGLSLPPSPSPRPRSVEGEVMVKAGGKVRVYAENST